MQLIIDSRSRDAQTSQIGVEFSEVAWDVILAVPLGHFLDQSIIDHCGRVSDHGFLYATLELSEMQGGKIYC
jgi:hypothetical protein